MERVDPTEVGPLIVGIIFLLVAIGFFCLGLFLINRGDWWNAKRTTNFGLMTVYSEWDLFWIRCKIFIITWAGKISLWFSVTQFIFAAIWLIVYWFDASTNSW